MDWRLALQQLVGVWNGLTAARKMIVGGSVLAVLFMMFLLARMATETSMQLLYSGLENGAAGEVVSALEQHGVAYEVRGGAIFVDSTRRDELRMTLASEGLPANGAKGYELLDTLSGFGTTSQMFDAAYTRAKEGELARTIMASPHITSARVHIAATGGNPFQQDLRSSASISVTTSNGALAPSQAKALKYLVASAVAGLSPENVNVIDGSGSLVASIEGTAPASTAEDRATQMREKVLRLVEARVGYGNAVVEVSVETDTKSENIREKRFDPEGRVAISTDTEERNTQSSDSGGGAVTVASNLPDGEAGSGDSSQSRNNETRERINYEISETQREVSRGPGAIEKISVAVLVNGDTTTDAAGQQVFSPLPENELNDLRDLVASAVGFNETRGDQITIRSMPFELPPMGAAPVAPGMFSALAINAENIIKLAILAVVTLILAIFVIRPILSGQSEPLAIAGSTPATGASDLPALTGEIQDDSAPFEFAQASVDDMLPAISESFEPSDPVERLRGMIGERKEETIEILKSWLDDREERV